jgi:hypothetical protein
LSRGQAMWIWIQKGMVFLDCARTNYKIYVGKVFGDFVRYSGIYSFDNYWRVVRSWKAHCICTRVAYLITLNEENIYCTWARRLKGLLHWQFAAWLLLWSYWIGVEKIDDVEIKELNGNTKKIWVVLQRLTNQSVFSSLEVEQNFHKKTRKSSVITKNTIEYEWYVLRSLRKLSNAKWGEIVLWKAKKPNITMRPTLL